MEKELRVQREFGFSVLQGLVHILNFDDVIIILRKDKLFHRTPEAFIFEVIDRIILSGAVFLIKGLRVSIDFRIFWIQVFFGLHLSRYDIIFVSESDHYVHLVVDLEAHLEVLSHSLIVRVDEPMVFSHEHRLTKILGPNVCS